MGFLSWFKKDDRIPVRRIIQDKILLAGKLMLSDNKKEVERGRKILKKIKSIEDLNEKYSGKIDWIKELKELNDI
jgi:hypothetical protein